jgi:hypothetical protein
MNFLISVFWIFIFNGFTLQKENKNNEFAVASSEKHITIELEYIIWGCECPNWITKEDYKKYSDTNLIAHCFYVEPADKNTNYLENFNPEKQLLKVTGYFEKEKRIPDDLLNSEEIAKEAKMFVFFKSEIVEK